MTSIFLNFIVRAESTGHQFNIVLANVESIIPTYLVLHLLFIKKSNIFFQHRILQWQLYIDKFEFYS